MELERASIMNEQRLLEELEDILFRLSGKDKKLKAKDQQDAMQLVCKARSAPPVSASGTPAGTTLPPPARETHA